VHEFISEDDLRTFEGWLRYQAVDASTMPADELAMWRRLFEEVRQRSATSPKVGLMKLQPVPGEHKYAVAVEEGADLWLTLWVRCSRKGEFFIMQPRGDRELRGTEAAGKSGENATMTKHGFESRWGHHSCRFSAGMSPRMSGVIRPVPSKR